MPDIIARSPSIRGTAPRHLSSSVGIAGTVIAAPFFLWLVLGAAGLIPSVIDVFGVTGLRIPAAITIGGLLLAAVGFLERRPQANP